MTTHAISTLLRRGAARSAAIRALLVSSLLALGACAGPSGGYAKPESVDGQIAVTRDDIAGQTLQRITPVGLRWMSFEADGSWHTKNENNRPIGGGWQIEEGSLCVEDSVWYPDGNCFSFYGSAAAISRVVSDANSSYYQPASLFRTADPMDGVGEVMLATASSPAPFPARTSKIFFSASELAGKRVEMTTGTREWFEFHSGGKVVLGIGGDDGKTGSWKISEFGDVVITTGDFSKRTTYYDMLGSKETGIDGIRSYAQPFRYYSVIASPLSN